jgi:hypothetical protein
MGKRVIALCCFGAWGLYRFLKKGPGGTPNMMKEI